MIDEIKSLLSFSALLTALEALSLFLSTWFFSLFASAVAFDLSSSAFFFAAASASRSAFLVFSVSACLLVYPDVGTEKRKEKERERVRESGDDEVSE